MKPPAISLDKLLALEPYLEVTVPDTWTDRNGHMNIRWYVAVFDDAGDELYLRLGLTPEFHLANKTGSFDLEHHTHFLNEVMPGDQLAVFVRPVSVTPKRMHYVMYMVNRSHKNLAAMFECVNAFADMRERKTAPFPPEVAARLEAWMEADSRVAWRPPACGVMKA